MTPLNNNMSISLKWELRGICRGIQLVVVDDDKDTLNLVQMTLKEEYEIQTCENPVDVPEMISVFEPDLVILDVMMPKVTGFQLAVYMKKKPGLRDIPFVFLSAKSDIRDQKYGYKIGASSYLTKPFQPSRLLKNVKLVFEDSSSSPRKKRFTAQEVEMRWKIHSNYKLGMGNKTPEQQMAKNTQQSEDNQSLGHKPHDLEEEEEKSNPRWLD